MNSLGFALAISLEKFSAICEAFQLVAKNRDVETSIKAKPAFPL